MLPRQLTRLPTLVLGALLVALALLVTGCSAQDTQQDTPAVPGRSTPAWARGMSTVPESGLPAEARTTLTLIDKGGPFPYTKDGSVFGNFERELPRQSRGYYHEYTVPTPGERDRGARRIVMGRSHETYYTDDHYESFKAVLR
ncbi:MULTISPECIES: ribonuclease domain-containing protein [unclassified Streptomyces]|uniref:ribonuclease domain-containing protein n=1 Tax=unclassified Streptomyces TaxID=2593676 RepID=UPI0022523DD8|nr:ribonuclease domain-containing protein [Streptomyces sp. NBC_00401]MCX5080418.1 ribonuclease N [Streptomyces sp. NBC_00401]